MRKFLCFCCVLLWGIGMLGVAGAAPIKYELQGIFDDGGVLSGTFAWDYEAETISAINVTTGVGTTLGGFQYDERGSIGLGGDERSLSAVSFTGGNGYYWLSLVFDDGLWTENTSSDIGSGSREEDNYGEDGTARFLVGGHVATAAVPEPSSLLLLGSGVVWLAGYGRKKFKK